MKKLILSIAIFSAAFMNANAQSDTLVFRNSNNHELGVAIGDDYYPFTNISENAKRIFEGSGYTVKKPSTELLALYHTGEFNFLSEKQKLKAKKKASRTRGYYLRMAGVYKNTAMALQGVGTGMSLLTSRDSFKMSVALGTITTISSIALNVAGNNALIKAGEVK